MRLNRLFSISAAAAFFGGCVSSDLGYGPKGGPDKRLYGYSETRRADGAFTVVIDYKATPDALPVLHSYFDRRAEELCGGPPAKSVVIKAERPNIVNPNISSRSYQTSEFDQIRGAGVVLEGIVMCEDEASAATDHGDEPAPAQGVEP